MACGLAATFNKLNDALPPDQRKEPLEADVKAKGKGEKGKKDKRKKKDKNRK